MINLRSCGRSRMSSTHEEKLPNRLAGLLLCEATLVLKFDTKFQNHDTSYLIARNPWDNGDETFLENDIFHMTMMEYMIRLTQVHTNFRLAEIKALAVLENIDLEVLSYSPAVSASLTAAWL
jgi:hypothetical protein